MKKISVKKVNNNFSIEKILNEKGYQKNFDYYLFGNTFINGTKANIWGLSILKELEMQNFILAKLNDYFIILNSNEEGSIQANRLEDIKAFLEKQF